MNKISKGGMTAAVCLFVASSAMSQYTSSGYEIWLNTGTLIYQGELTPKFYGYTKAPKPSLGVAVSKSLTRYFAVRASLATGKINANESAYSNPVWRQYRNLKFSSSITELGAAIVFHPFGSNEYRGSRSMPYIFGGAGFTFLNVKRDWSGFKASYFDEKSIAALSLGTDTLTSPPKTVVVLPIGVGYKYMLSSNLAFNAELNWRLAASDYIDGFKYNDAKNNRDSYYGVSVGVIYTLGSNRYSCPTIKR